MWRWTKMNKYEVWLYQCPFANYKIYFHEMTRHDNDVAYYKNFLQLVRNESQKKTLPIWALLKWGGEQGLPGPIDFDTLLKVKKFPKVCEGRLICYLQCLKDRMFFLGFLHLLITHIIQTPRPTQNKIKRRRKELSRLYCPPGSK